jgi:hypothetical protein
VKSATSAEGGRKEASSELVVAGCEAPEINLGIIYRRHERSLDSIDPLFGAPA